MPLAKRDAMYGKSFPNRVRNPHSLERFILRGRFIANDECLMALVDNFASQALGIHFGSCPPIRKERMNDKDDAQPFPLLAATSRHGARHSLLRSPPSRF